MATRPVLAELTERFQRQTGSVVDLESVGGVLAAARVQAGQDCDLVILSMDAMHRLAAANRLLPDSRVDFARSPVAMATGRGHDAVNISSELAVRAAVLSATRIGYSTGPSGTALVGLFQRWGIEDDIRDRLVQAPAGVPVAQLLTRGEVTLGFQQLSELLHAEGIQLLGPLPPAIAITTVFSAAIAASSQNTDAARALLDFLNTPEADVVKRLHGMDAATSSTNSA